MRRPETLVLTEDKLRAFTKCPAFYHFGGTTILPIKTAIVEFVYIRLILEMMRDVNFDYKFTLNRTLGLMPTALGLKDTLSPEEIKEYKRHAAICIDEIFKLLNPQRYLPAFGPFEYTVQVSKSIVKPRISSLLATNVNNYHSRQDKDRSKVLQAVTFSPYTNSRDMENDIVQRIKAMTLAKASPLKAKTVDSYIRLHIFSVSPTSFHLNYGCIEWGPKIDTIAWAKYIEAPIKAIEAKYDYPIIPCNFSCPYKPVCSPDPFREVIEDIQ